MMRQILRSGTTGIAREYALIAGLLLACIVIGIGHMAYTISPADRGAISTLGEQIRKAALP